MGAIKEFPERVNFVFHRAVVTSGSHSLGTSSVNCLSEGRKYLIVLCRVTPSFRGGGISIIGDVSIGGSQVEEGY